MRRIWMGVVLAVAVLAPLAVSTPAGAATPVFTVSESSFAFGNRTVGDHVSHTFLVQNASAGAILVQAAHSGSAAFVLVPGPATQGQCFTTVNGVAQYAVLQPQAACLLQVEFRPYAAGGANGTVRLSEYATPGEQATFRPKPSGFPRASKNLTLTGRALKPSVAFDPPSLAFGATTLGSVGTRVTTVTNTSTIPVAVTAPKTATFGMALPPSGDACWSSLFFTAVRVLAPGSSCRLVIEYAPSRITFGTVRPNLAVKIHSLPDKPTGDQGSQILDGAPVTAVNLPTSEAAVNPAITFTPTSPVDFGGVIVGETGHMTVYVNNSSPARVAFKVGGVSNNKFFPEFPPVDPAACHSGTEGELILDSYDTCVLHYTFTPTAPGPQQGNVTIKVYAFHEAGPGHQWTPTATPHEYTLDPTTGIAAGQVTLALKGTGFAYQPPS